jgi:hypothetical protein
LSWVAETGICLRVAPRRRGGLEFGSRPTEAKAAAAHARLGKQISDCRRFVARRLEARYWTFVPRAAAHDGDECHPAHSLRGIAM